jgi:DNA polymerase-3 subunit gamma/tau
VVGLEGHVLTLGFSNAGARDSFVSSGCAEVVHQAAIDVVGADWKVETIVDPGAQPEGTPVITRAATDPPAQPEAPDAPQAAPEAPPEWASDELPAEGSTARTAAREAILQTRVQGTETPRSSQLAEADADARRDDLDVDPDDAQGEDLLARELGASMIEEIKHS